MSSLQIPVLENYASDRIEAAFQALREDVSHQASAVATAEAREQFRLHWLGRKQGRLKLISDAWLKNAPTEARKTLGQHFNQLKQQIEQALAAEPAPPSALPTAD
ncbi:MAG: phenylalanine--tRNA ligase subunit alpha, partial [Acidobacteriaceae bacterium]